MFSTFVFRVNLELLIGLHHLLEKPSFGGAVCCEIFYKSFFFGHSLSRTEENFEFSKDFVIADCPLRLTTLKLFFCQNFKKTACALPKGLGEVVIDRVRNFRLLKVFLNCQWFAKKINSKVSWQDKWYFRAFFGTETPCTDPSAY